MVVENNNNGRPPPPFAAVVRYLEELRADGSINMFAAHPYIMREFHVDHIVARQLLFQWINTLRATRPIGPHQFSPDDMFPADDN